MICPQCKKEGKKSKVYSEGSTSTLMYCKPYYDEEGVYHHHDSNTITSTYRCSNHHYFVTKGTSECPGCDWGGVEKTEIISDGISEG